jgi:hypothetical protein
VMVVVAEGRKERRKRLGEVRFKKEDATGG